MGNCTKTCEINTSGHIYITVAREPFFEQATGLVKTKIGISFADHKATAGRGKHGKTYQGDRLRVLQVAAVDEDTLIPRKSEPFHFKGGIDEMESYLHDVCEERWEDHGGRQKLEADKDSRTPFQPLKYTGGGEEWFCLPIEVLKMITTIKNIRKGNAKMSDLDMTPFPELAKVLLYAPKQEDIPSMHESRFKWKSGGREFKVNTTERTRQQIEQDKAAERKHRRDYMLDIVT